MEIKSSNALRSAFLDFFRDRQHEIVASSSLVPDDDSLLFTNAGMVQFKDTFLGMEPRPYKRAASSQRCVRAGGKHNDLDNVGYTARHHTFFEMLGNFSFGDYFKKEAIQYAWRFLTDVCAIDQDKLWVTVYDKDQEAADIWLKDIKVSKQRFTRIATSDNFWSMGETGPCGPCSEIFYDHGSSVPGGPPGSSDEDGDRYVEIWNLVFMQYNRSADGAMSELPHPSVDTGMGLERLAAVMQGVHSNYGIDLFQQLIKAAAQITGTKHVQGNELRVIADHIRSCAFLIVDGVVPANTKHGYVLRRIIRRAIRHGYELGVRKAFFHRMVEPLCEQMGAAYPELVNAKHNITKVLLAEEEKFAETLETGMKKLEEKIRTVTGKEIPGDLVFDLYATYGFPEDLTADYARRKGYTIDWPGFEAAKIKHSEGHEGFDVVLPSNVSTVFSGYEKQRDEAKVVALYKEKLSVRELAAGEEGIVFLDRTPFYAESGGQVGDSGVLVSKEAVFKVSATRKYHSHMGQLSHGRLSVGDTVRCEIHPDKRADTARNHTATHLMHAALRKVLGDHVQQKGSLVDADHLRFDFSHNSPVTKEEIYGVEQMVNEQIRANTLVEVHHMAYQQAINTGAMALFGEKYGDEVRVLRVGDFSTELCGGTHVERAGDIGFFKILSEGGTSAGVRRIEAVTGAKAVLWAENLENDIKAMAAILKTAPEQVGKRLQQAVEKAKALEKDLQKLKAKLATSQGGDMLERIQEVAGIQLVIAQMDGTDSNTLRETVDRIKDRIGSGAVVLGGVEDGKVKLVAGVTKDLVGRLKAGDLIKAVAEKVGGKGGGRPDFAQAGGNLPDQLPSALDFVPKWIESRLKA